MPKFTPKPGYRFDPVPPQEALDYFRRKGWKPGFDYRDVWREEHAVAFTVAKAMNLDVLGSIREAVDKALAEGRTFRRFQQDLEPTLQKLGWWGVQPTEDPKTGKKRLAMLGSPRRLRVIYHANLRTAHAAGQWERIQRNRRTHPFLRYRLGPSREHREQHAAWAGLILPVDDPFWNTHMPPNGWGCKCSVRQVTRPEAERRGGPSKSPKIRYRNWRNKRTGQVERVPVGIDPGWDTNPGQARRRQAEKLLREKEAVFKKAVETPLRRPVWPVDADPVFTTSKGATREAVESALRQIPDAQEQVDALAAFLHVHGTKALLLRQSEMTRGHASERIAEAIGRFLGWKGPYPQTAFTHPRPTRVSGFTSSRFGHVVVKVRSTDRLAAIDPATYPRAIERVIGANRSGRPVWSTSEAHRGLTGGKQSSAIVTFVHELGHQVHNKAGMPRRPEGLPSLTLYSTYSDNEWHAEHWAAWVLNRRALNAWSPDVVKYLDDLMAKVVKGPRK